MDKVRVFSLKGEFLGVSEARRIPYSSRHGHVYKCMGCDSAEYHLVARHPGTENTKEIRQHAVRNSSTRHEDVCRYRDNQHSGGSSAPRLPVKAGVRINFPMGDHYGDIDPRGADLSYMQRNKIRHDRGKQSASSVTALVALLEKSFKTLRNPDLDSLQLHYQGQPERRWKSVFASGGHYERLYNAVATHSGKIVPGMLGLVLPTDRSDRDRHGYTRVYCEKRECAIERDGRSFKYNIEPVLVFKTDALAKKAENGSLQIVAARPYIPSGIVDGVESDMNNGWGGNQTLRVYLYVGDERQFGSVKKDEYWRPSAVQRPFRGAQVSQTSLFENLSP